MSKPENGRKRTEQKNGQMINRRGALKTVSAAGLGAMTVSGGTATAQQTDEKPNIFLILAEDWNWGTINDDPALETPAFDEVAEQGMRFRRTFCSAPSCTPSRSAIVTGQDFWRLGPAANLWGTFPAELTTYTDLLNQAGYFVGHTKKRLGTR